MRIYYLDVRERRRTWVQEAKGVFSDEMLPEQAWKTSLSWDPMLVCLV